MKIKIKRLLRGAASVVDVMPSEDHPVMMTAEQIMYLSWRQVGEQLLDAKEIIDEEIGTARQFSPSSRRTPGKDISCRP